MSPAIVVRLAEAGKARARLTISLSCGVAAAVMPWTRCLASTMIGPTPRIRAVAGREEAIVNNMSTERARSLLERGVLFRALDERERHDLASHAQPRTFAANEPIFHVGEPGHSMMGVVVGTVRISLPAPKGREVILADLPPGELFGEIALLDGKPRSANAIALTRCELLVLERRDVLPFLEHSPTACVNLMQLLCARIRRSDERMAEIAFFDLPARLARALLRYPAQDHGPRKLSLSQRELAELSGATRENVNRCLREWQRSGILELKNRWTIILKPEALRALEEPN